MQAVQLPIFLPVFAGCQKNGVFFSAFAQREKRGSDMLGLISRQILSNQVKTIYIMSYDVKHSEGGYKAVIGRSSRLTMKYSDLVYDSR
jgi:hypothetical protein